MIAVIADDFTGAAEIAGLGWRHGLRVLLLPWISAHRSPISADLLVLDSDSRNLSAATARKRVRALALALRVAQPKWVFKKMDSVLRGNVLPEIRALQRALAMPRALLVPANPNAGRTIRDGHYHIHGTPIHRTDFRYDPRHPRRSSRVLDLLEGEGKPATRVQVLKRGDELARSQHPAIAVGEVTTFADVQHWAALADDTTLAAGGADFFRALLKRRCRQTATASRQPGPGTSPTPRPGPWLFVCGSLADSSRQFIADRQREGWPVLPMPRQLLLGAGRTGPAFGHWVSQAVHALAIHSRIILTIGGRHVPGADAPVRLGRLLTDAVAQVLSQCQPAAVCVEGGATAAQLIARLGWQRLSVAGEFATGVVGLRPAERPELLLVCKPGSYAWPARTIRPGSSTA